MADFVAMDVSGLDAEVARVLRQMERASPVREDNAAAELS
jgi:hypothetical protein